MFPDCQGFPHVAVIKLGLGGKVSLLLQWVRNRLLSSARGQSVAFQACLQELAWQLLESSSPCEFTTVLHVVGYTHLFVLFSCV